jgi:hypothetical protein
MNKTPGSKAVALLPGFAGGATPDRQHFSIRCLATRAGCVLLSAPLLLRLDHDVDGINVQVVVIVGQDAVDDVVDRPNHIGA